MSELTRVLNSLVVGDPAAAEELLPLLYEELRKLAADKPAHEGTGQTLQATALVHEAYPWISGDKEKSWERGPSTSPMPRIWSRRHGRPPVLSTAGPASGRTGTVCCEPGKWSSAQS